MAPGAEPAGQRFLRAGSPLVRLAKIVVLFSALRPFQLKAALKVCQQDVMGYCKKAVPPKCESASELILHKGKLS